LSILESALTSPQPPSPSWPPTAGGPGPQPPVSGAPYGPPVSGAPVGAAPAGRPGRGVARLAMVVAAVAVLLAMSSLGVAAWALRKADQATDALAALPPPPGSPPPDAGATPEPGPTPSDAETTTGPDAAEPTSTGASIAPLNPQSVFKLFYEKRTLNVQVPGCETRYVDLDEPRLDAQSAADISLAACTGGIPKMEFTDGVVAAVGESAMTPNECAEQIQFSAIPATKDYALRKGDAYCIQTSLAAANSRGDSQRMVVVTVTGVSADKLVTLQATAYIVPE